MNNSNIYIFLLIGASFNIIMLEPEVLQIPGICHKCLLRGEKNSSGILDLNTSSSF